MAATGLLGVNPYFKGVEINTDKPTQMAIGIEQRDQAKREALDKYFMDYEKSLNSAGMRTQDQDVFLKKLAQNKQYYLQNRDKILNPGRYGAEAQSEYMSKYKDILSDINRSKQLAANGKVLATAVTDATKNNRTIPKEITDAIYNNQLSIGDNRHVDFDPVNFDAYDKHDEGKYKQAIYSNIKPSESLPIPHKDKDNHTLFYETKNEIGKNALPEIENSVDSELRKNRGLIDVVKDISADQNKLNNLGKIYSDFTGGTKKMDPKSLHDIATAYTIAIRPNAVVKYTDPKEDADYRRLQGIYDYWRTTGATANKNQENAALAVQNYLTNAATDEPIIAPKKSIFGLNIGSQEPSKFEGLKKLNIGTNTAEKLKETKFIPKDDMEAKFGKASKKDTKTPDFAYDDNGNIYQYFTKTVNGSDIPDESTLRKTNQDELNAAILNTNYNTNLKANAGIKLQGSRKTSSKFNYLPKSGKF
jgi:hypothetical protein